MRMNNGDRCGDVQAPRHACGHGFEGFGPIGRSGGR